MAKTLYATEDGFYDGFLIKAGQKFEVHDEFEPAWASADPEAPDEVLPANRPQVDDKFDLAAQAAAAGDPVKQPVVATAKTRSTSDPKKAAAAAEAAKAAEGNDLV